MCGAQFVMTLGLSASHLNHLDQGQHPLTDHYRHCHFHYENRLEMIKIPMGSMCALLAMQ